MTRAELKQVRALIANHDKWHGEIGEVIFPDATDVTVDLTDAYSDSTLYAETCEALALLDAELAKPEAREWRVLAEARRTVKVRIGTSCLTRDLVWCECERGLNLTGNWLYCPKCGGSIDQESYASAIAEALKNGAHLYLDADAMELKADAEALRALAVWIAEDVRSVAFGKHPEGWYVWLYEYEERVIERVSAPTLAAAIMDALGKVGK